MFMNKHVLLHYLRTNGWAPLDDNHVVYWDAKERHFGPRG